MRRSNATSRLSVCLSVCLSFFLAACLSAFCPCFSDSFLATNLVFMLASPTARLWLPVPFVYCLFMTFCLFLSFSLSLSLCLILTPLLSLSLFGLFLSTSLCRQCVYMPSC